MLVSGGGSRNRFLMDTLKQHLRSAAIHVLIDDTDTDVGDYKEAIIIAFLSMFTLMGRVNIASEGTGARMDSVSGSVHFPPTQSEHRPWKPLL